MEAIKIIVTNRSAIENKYGRDAGKVIKLLDGIIDADKKREIGTSVIFVDKTADMKKVKGKAVKDHTNEEQNVTAVQNIFKSANPDYLLIFGSADIIPLIAIKNPVYKEFADEDDEDEDGDNTELDPEDGKYILSDLPYACDVPFTKGYKRYMSGKHAIRVVGRLPDIIDNPSLPYFKKIVKHASGWKSKQEQTENAFVLSTNDWSKISRATAKSLFGNKFNMHISRNQNSKEDHKLKNYDLHLINCHGDVESPAFFNSQSGFALTSKQLNRKIKKGSVVAAECCFGAELFWDPQIDLAMASNYLEEGAYAFMGSTTTSYGATNKDNEPFDADIITRYFLKYVLEGRSTGSALQQARIDFKRDVFSTTGGADVLPSYKTLLQFYLIGDPSIHYIRKNNAEEAPVPKGIKKRRKASSVRAERLVTPRVTAKKVGKPVREVPQNLEKLLDKYGMKNAKVQTFQSTAITPAPALIETKGSIVSTSSKRLAAKATLPSSKKITQKVAVKKTRIKGSNIKIAKLLFVTQENGKTVKVKYVESK